jgi:hypothetical protein
MVQEILFCKALTSIGLPLRLDSKEQWLILRGTHVKNMKVLQNAIQVLFCLVYWIS